MYRAVSVLRQRVFIDLHLPGTLLSNAEQELPYHQCFQRKQQQSQRGFDLQLCHFAEAGHAADCQHLQPAIYCCHPGYKWYIRVYFIVWTMSKEKYRSCDIDTLQCSIQQNWMVDTESEESCQAKEGILSLVSPRVF